MSVGVRVVCATVGSGMVRASVGFFVWPVVVGGRVGYRLGAEVVGSVVGLKVGLRVGTRVGAADGMVNEQY